MAQDKVGTIKFVTQSACALFDAEILGQLSDGRWENTRPHEHYRLWFKLTPVVGEENKVILDWGRYCAYNQRTGYNLSGLIPVIGDRMLKIGRMGTVTLSSETLRAAEYMPDTITEWEASKRSGKWEYDFVAKYMEHVSNDIAVAYYLTRYTVKDLKADLAHIKQAMKSVAPLTR